MEWNPGNLMATKSITSAENKHANSLDTVPEILGIISNKIPSKSNSYTKMIIDGVHVERKFGDGVDGNQTNGNPG
jgi:hypothetical protein